MTLALWEHLGWCQALNSSLCQSFSVDAKPSRASVLNQLICRLCFIYKKFNPSTHVCAKMLFYPYHRALSPPFRMSLDPTFSITSFSEVCWFLLTCPHVWKGEGTKVGRKQTVGLKEVDCSAVGMQALPIQSSIIEKWSSLGWQALLTTLITAIWLYGNRSSRWIFDRSLHTYHAGRCPGGRLMDWSIARTLLCNAASGRSGALLDFQLPLQLHKVVLLVTIAVLVGLMSFSHPPFCFWPELNPAVFLRWLTDRFSWKHRMSIVCLWIQWLPC